LSSAVNGEDPTFDAKSGKDRQQERESIAFCVTGCLDDAKTVRIVSTDVPPQRSLRGRGRGTGSRNACPNVWAWSEDGVAPGASSWSTDCSEVRFVGWIGSASPNSSRWRLADGAGMTPFAASLASLASSILRLISRRRRMRASPISPAATNISVVLRGLKLPNPDEGSRPRGH